MENNEIRFETVETETEKITYRIGNVNQDKVDYALIDVKRVQNEIKNLIDNVESLKELIPLHQGTKDELGENTEKYIDEIKQNIDDNIDKQIDKILNEKNNIKAKALNKDIEEKTIFSREPITSLDAE